MSAPLLDASAFLARYAAMDRALVASGFPATSPWWMSQIDRLIRTLATRLDPNRRRSLLRRWIIRAGRRAGKSTTISRLLVAWALWGCWLVPLGDIAVVAIVSVDRGEAAARLRTIADVLTALRIPFEQRAEEIELTTRRVVFKVFTCSITGVLGFTAIAVFCDEVAFWSNRETGQNPASRVVPALAPTQATQAFAFMVLSSAAWTPDDFHAKAFGEGDTDFQIVSEATTWEANPSLSEADTHALEPAHDDWLRAYGNVPSAATTENYFAQGIELSIDHEPQAIDRARWHTIAVDPKFSQNTKDRFGVAVVSSISTARDPRTLELVGRRTIVHQAHAWTVDRGPLEMAKRLRDEVLRPHNHGGRVFSDQFEGYSFKELCSSIGVRLEIIPWTGGDQEDSKLQRFRKVRMAMFEGAFRIPNDPDLIREFRSVRRVLSPAGNERIEIPRTTAGHGDRVSAIVLAASIALNARPQFPVSMWTFEDYAIEQRNYQQRAGFGGFYHPVFCPSGERGGWRFSYEQLRELIRAGQFKETPRYYPAPACY